MTFQLPGDYPSAGAVVRRAGGARWRWPALCLVLLALSACVLPANVPAPKSIAPPNYRAQSRSHARGQTGVWPSVDWWRGFGSPDLDMLILRARSANLDIAAAAARVAQADAQIRVAGAPLFPSLDAQGSGSKSYRAGISGGNNQFANVPTQGARTQKTYQAALNASYEIDFWGKNRSALAAARQSDFASRFDKATVALGVDASVATTYFTIVALKDRLRIARKNLGIAKQLLKALKAELQVGVGTALDVAQQETQVATQLTAIPPLKQQMQENINALAVLLGEPPEQIRINIVKPSDLFVPKVDAGLPSTLLTRRPDIAEARAQLNAAHSNVVVAKAALFPNFDLSAQGGWESAAFNTLFNPLSKFYSLAGNLTQPLFEGGRLRGQLAVNRGRYAELLADYQSSVLSAFEDVDNALTDIRQTSRQVKLQQQAVKVAQRALNISRARLHQGITDVTTVLNTEQALFSAQDNLAQDQLARLNATVSLYQALGGGWDEATAKQSQNYSEMPRF